ADKPRLRSFLKDFIALLNSRIVSENVRTPAGKTVRTINIDPNSPSKHPDNRYAGDTASSFPGWQNPGEKPKRVPRFAESAGWDISHARRFVYLTWSLDRVAVDLGLIAKTEARDIGVALANTLAYRN